MAEQPRLEPCPYCGRKISSSADRCRYCGKVIEDEDYEVEDDDDEPAPTDPAIKWLVPIDRSGWAIASGYLALLSCIPFLGFFLGAGAVVTGILALRELGRKPRLGGKGRAIFGIGVGILTTLGNSLLLIWLAADALRKH